MKLESMIEQGYHPATLFRHLMQDNVDPQFLTQTKDFYARKYLNANSIDEFLN